MYTYNHRVSHLLFVSVKVDGEVAFCTLIPVKSIDGRSELLLLFIRMTRLLCRCHTIIGAGDPLPLFGVGRW